MIVDTAQSEQSGIIRDEKGRLVKGGANLNPGGRPKGRSWSGTLAQLAETKVRGGGGMTRAELILKKLLDKAESGDLNAISLIMDRIEGRPVAKVINDHYSGGLPLNANVSFVDPIKEIDITPPNSPGNPE